MNRLYSALLAAAVLACASATFAGTAPDRIDPYLRSMLSATGPQQFIDTYVVLADRLSYDDLMAQTVGLKRKARQAEVARILKEHSAQTRGGVESFLRNAEAQGLAKNIQIIWAVNSISFTATLL